MGNEVAYIMYRWSSMYLAFLFLALILDAENRAIFSTV